MKLNESQLKQLVYEATISILQEMQDLPIMRQRNQQERLNRFGEYSQKEWEKLTPPQKYTLSYDFDLSPEQLKQMGFNSVEEWRKDLANKAKEWAHTEVGRKQKAVNSHDNLLDNIVNSQEWKTLNWQQKKSIGMQLLKIGEREEFESIPETDRWGNKIDRTREWQRRYGSPSPDFVGDWN